MDNSSLCKMFHSLGTVPRSKPPWGHMINCSKLARGHIVHRAVAAWPLVARASSQRNETGVFVQWRLSYLSAADFGASNNV